jgi:Xaa-Pro aminopeptidase
VDALLVSSLPNVRYLSGFSGSSGLLVVGAGAGDLFFTDFRYQSQVAAELDPAIDVRIVSEDLLKTVREVLAERGVGRVAFERAQLSYRAWSEWSEAEGPALVPVEEWVEEVRAVKSEAEIDAIRTACRITDETFQFLLDAVRPGVTERELAGHLELELVRRGAEGSSFEPIVAFGERSALPHARPTGRELARGELVLFDFGAVAGGYVSDMTRTVACGDPPAGMLEVYAVELEAQSAALAGIRAGLTGPEADALARGVIDAAGHGSRFGHSLGHGIGIEVHEAPRLSRKSVDTLAAGMVVTVEPGIYVDGIGGVRIEDDAAIGSTGLLVLSGSPKDELIVL